jgi:hypothetical protein
MFVVGKRWTDRVAGVMIADSGISLEWMSKSKPLLDTSLRRKLGENLP